MSAENSYGYCQCGCGEKTWPSPRNIPERGILKGEPVKFKRGHNARVSHPAWTGDDCTYAAAHARVFAERGSAKDRECEHCGASANEWAYDHKDASEKTDPLGRPYSPRTKHYIPLCYSCHCALDRPPSDSCPKGHPWTDGNTILNASTGYRRCRECLRASNNATREEREARRRATPATHCRNGHPYELFAGFTSTKGKRYCRECSRISDTRRRERNRRKREEAEAA